MHPSLKSLDKIVSRIFENRTKLENRIKLMQKEANEIKKHYKPRAEFERWRDSNEGREWKRVRYHLQKGHCSLCSLPIELKGSHIDHIKPITKFPELNLSVSNLRITCPMCNQKKGAH